MADRLSALAHLSSAAAPATGRATLSEARYASIVQIQAWPDTHDTVRAVLVAELLDETAPTVGSAIVHGDAVVAAIAPGRTMVAGSAPDLRHRLETAIPAGDGTVTDVTHGRVILALEGEAAPSVLAKCVMIDVDPAAFPPGRVASTAIHHVDVMIHRLSVTRFELWVLRSFAASLAEWLIDAGVENGAAFRA